MDNIRLMKIEDIDQVVKLETKYLGETLGYEMILNEINNNSNQELEGVLFYVIEENEKDNSDCNKQRT